VALGRLLLAALVILTVADDRTPVPGFFDLPVTGGTTTFDMLGLRPEERGSAIALLARSMFSQGGSAAERAAGVRRFIAGLSVPGNVAADPPSPPSFGDTDSQPITIAVPLTADHWRDLLGPAGKGDLFAALLANRSVLLVCAGAMNTDASVRALLARDRGLLRYIVRSTPAALWVAGRSLKLEKDRVVVPGGSTADPIWEALAGEKVTRPSEFLRVLLSRDSGRLAWFFDAIAAMSADRRALVYGHGAIDAQIEQTRALYSTFKSADSNWRLEDHPFLRGVTDSWMVTSQIELAGGAVALPNAQLFWEDLFEHGDLTRRAITASRAAVATPASLAWLVQKVASVHAKERRDRYEMVRFAHAVFPRMNAEDTVDVMVALGGYRRYRAMLLALDHMEITTPRVYSRLVEAARRLDELSGRDRKHSIIAFQSALALLARARATHAISVPVAEQRLLALADVAEVDNRHMHAITQWMITSLLDSLPPLVQPDQWTAATAYESRLLQALAGPPTGTNVPTLKWEGLDYRVDYFASEHARIKRIREQLTSPGLDAALAANNDAQVAEALLVLIYSPALGDPEGPALLGGDIALRHDFGLEGAAGLRRDTMAWAMPREQVGDGRPWHIEGSLLGLDIALARLALRRLSDDDMPVAPTINLNDQMTLARTARALNPNDLRDADRDRIVEAIARGRQRVAGAAANLADVLALADEAALSPAVRQTLQWTVTRTPESVPALFGLRDYMWLGRPDLPRDTLNRWGVYAESLHNRLRTAMPGPTPWENFSGRADGGLIATQFPDLTLRMAEETVRLKLPAQLIPALLTFATQDFWHDVDSRFPDDWPALARQALALSPSRVEDYVAALAGDGPLRPR
jgi:hypothetical protein